MNIENILDIAITVVEKPSGFFIQVDRAKIKELLNLPSGANKKDISLYFCDTKEKANKQLSVWKIIYRNDYV